MDKISVSVVGSSLSAVKLLDSWSLRPELALSWYQSKYDLEYRETPAWYVVPQAFIPSRLQSALQKIAKPVSPSIFLNPFSRCDLAHLLSGNSGVHSSVARKVFAWGLWADSTPSLWQGSEPDVQWPTKAPLTSLYNEEPLLCFEKREFYRLMELEFSNCGVHVADPTSCVLGLEVDKLEHRLIMNSPHALQKAKHIIWAHKSKEPYQEALSRNLESISQPAYRWVHKVAKVSRAIVSALPEFSLWVDMYHLAYGAFLKTGEWKEGVLFQVLSPRPEGKDSLERWVQIRVLMEQNSSYDFQVPRSLLDLCPLLKDLRWEDSFVDEDWCFKDPLSRVESVGSRIFFWESGLLNETELAIEKYRPRPEPKKKTASASADH